MNTISPESLSVIIATYNKFQWLRLVLEGLRNQTVKGFEIVLADDGSDNETVRQIRNYIGNHPEMRIKHIWHEDNGWRKNIALNKALAATTGSYICFLDADCIPAPEWAQDHLRLAAPKTVIAGRRATLRPEWNASLETTQTLDRRWFSRLRRRFILNAPFFPPHCHPLRVIHLPIINGKGVGQKPTGNLMGCNFGIHRKDLMEVNGFDERYLGPGIGEDIDLAYRLRHNGVRIYKASYQALTIHRNHTTAIQTVPSASDNNAILEETKRLHTTYTPFGIVK